MTDILWDPDKNRWLKENRGISFDEVLLSIAQGHIIDILAHPNPEKYPGQRIVLVNIKQYIYCVPFLETENGIYIKTVFPSRKYTRYYLGEVKEAMQPYDKSEQNMIESIENGEWISGPDSGLVAKRLQSYAQEELKRKSRINIRISARDLKAIKLKAVEEGMPYQTLIASVLHRYVTGKLKEI
jgi:predicted DNA binding CopG/RHH family protein